MARGAPGYCIGCRKARRVEALAVAGPTHRCSRCGEHKPAADFARSIIANKSGGYCRACRKLRYAERADAERERDRGRKSTPSYREAAKRRGSAYRARIIANPDAAAAVSRRNRRSGLLRRYGISVERYEALLASQCGCCACCGRLDVGRTGPLARGLHLLVDHDHVTGEVRGLVCHKCNVGIGALGDTVEGVKRALAYLERHALGQPNTTVGIDFADWLCN